MTTLRQALESIPWQLIITIGRQRGLTLNSNLPKSDLIAKVIPTLLHPGNLNPALARLPAPACQALENLSQAGGRCPARLLRQQYGPLRPMSQLVSRQGRAAAQSNLADFAPLEQLCLLGLAFLHRPTDDLFIPTDLLEPITHTPRDQNGGAEVALPENDLPSSDPGVYHSAWLCHDLAALSGLLQRDAVMPLHQRWLPPAFLKLWGQHCVLPPAFPAAASELKTHRRRFIHYLAEHAGLVTGPPPIAGRSGPKALLLPTPAARLWLKAPYPQQLETLWQAFTQPDATRWRTFRLPGYTWLADPAPLIAALQTELARPSPPEDSRFAQTMLNHQPHLLDLVPANMLNPTELLTEAITQLLAGPLRWLQKEEGPVPPPARYTLMAHLDPDPFQSHFILTPGPGLPAPADVAVAIEVSEIEPESGERGGKREISPLPSRSLAPRPPAPALPRSPARITAVSFIRAIQHGWSPPALIDTLNRLINRPLTGQETALLKNWAGAAGRMTLRHALILETTDPGVITRLASSRRGRPLIHRTLSSRAVIVDPARLDLLVQRLTEQEGLPPRHEIGALFQAQMKGDEEIQRTSLTLYPSHLWLAVKVYQLLGQHLSLPVRLPQALLDQISAAAAPGELAAAEVAAAQTLAALRQALDGRTPFPGWPEGGMPVIESLPLIQQALNAGQNLRLFYYSPGSDTLTHRVVEPYRLETHRDTPYLVGFCHHAQAERMFRLDRIREIETTTREDSAPEFFG